MAIIRFSPHYLDTLIQEARCSLRCRQHRNIHQSYQDPCQRLLNAIGMDSYIRPHRHVADPKVECLIAVRGRMALVLFGDTGVVEDLISFGTEKYADTESLAVGVELSQGVWHTVIALVPGSILFEAKAGPFDAKFAKEFAPWAPEEGTTDGANFLSSLRIRAMDSVE